MTTMSDREKRKMKVSKRAKKVNVTWEKETYYRMRSVYDCPTCKTTIKGSLNSASGIVRFKCCQCGQELIIENTAKEERSKN